MIKYRTLNSFKKPEQNVIIADYVYIIEKTKKSDGGHECKEIQLPQYFVLILAAVAF